MGMQLPLQGAHDTLGRFTQGAVLPLRSRTLPWAGSSCPFGAWHGERCSSVIVYALGER